MTYKDDQHQRRLFVYHFLLFIENQNLNSNLPTAAAVPAVPADQNLNAADSAVADDDNCLELELPSFVPCRLKLREDLEAEGQHGKESEPYFFLSRELIFVRLRNLISRDKRKLHSIIF